MRRKRNNTGFFIRAGLLWNVFFFSLAGGQAIEINGQFTTDWRAGLNDGVWLTNQEYGVLKFAQQVDDNLSVFTGIRIRYYGNPLGSVSGTQVLDANELGAFYSLYPFEFSLEEAYFTYLDFIVERLDVSAGKQRLSWGAADTLNPTDLLNPLDFSDLFDFGKKIPSLAVSLTYTFPVLDASWQVVFEPYSQVARLNPLFISEMERGLLPAYAGVTDNLQALATGGTFTDNTTGWTGQARAPEPDLDNFLFGTRAAASFRGFDVSLNYVTRLNDMPYMSRLNYNTTITGSGPYNVQLDSRAYTLEYYREHEIGCDVVKDFGLFLAWAEAAVFFQPEQTLVTALNNSPSGTPATVLSSDPYVKYTVGWDKNLGAGFYINMQFCHGFFNERGRNGTGNAGEGLQDYLLTRLEWSGLDDKLKLGLTGLANTNLYDGFAAASPRDYLADNWGLLGGFELTFSPSLNLAARLGIYGLDARGASSLAYMKDWDFTYLQFEYTF